VVSVSVYTNREKKKDNHLRLPISVGITQLNYKIGSTDYHAFQYDIRGKGFLDFEKNHYIDFVAMGPNNYALPNLGGYDQYSLDYKYKDNSSVIIGDFTNKVSNLLELGRAGRGIKIEQKTIDGTFSVFYQKARFAINQNYAFGGSYQKVINDNFKLKVNQITKSLSDKKGEFMSNLVSSSGYFKWKNLDVDAEVSFGLAKNKFDIAIYSEANYKIGKLRLHNITIRAGENYFGFYNNSNFFMNSANYRVSDKIYVGFNSSFSRINRSFDITTFSISPLSKVHSVFLSYRLNGKHMLMINRTNQEREDRLEPSTFHYNESFSNLSYSYSSAKLEIDAQARYGKSTNLLVSDLQGNRKSFASNLQPTVMVTSWLRLGGYLEYQHTNKFSSDNSIQNLLYYGGNVGMNYKDFIRLNFMYRNNYAPDEFFEKRNFSNVSLSFDFKNQSLSLIGGRSFSPAFNTNNQNTSFFSINYVQYRPKQKNMKKVKYP
jgi:hypothetical protein